jgi:hypothetical protein
MVTALSCNGVVDLQAIFQSAVAVESELRQKTLEPFKSDMTGFAEYGAAVAALRRASDNRRALAQLVASQT